jgi:hypothetical protein
MRARTGLTIGFMVLALLVYAVLIGYRGVALLATGEPLLMLLGLAVLALPALGAGLVARELAFGRACGQLAGRLADEGGLPVELPRRASGRVDRAAADGHFEAMRAEAEAEPDSWRAWFRLALAYDAAGDRRRARSAARHALELARRPG